MLDIDQFRQLIVIPALSNLQLYSKDAEELLVFTCAVESNGGTYIKQVNGPAVGIYQCEPNTHNDMWRNYILYKNNFVTQLALNFNVNAIPDISRLMSDLSYATAICRLHYARTKERIPNCTDVNAMWEYYKKYYNTPKGAAEKEPSIQKYYDFLRLPKSRQKPQKQD